MKPILAAVALLALGMTGCPHHHARPSPPKPKAHHVPHPHHKVVVVERAHRCHAHCGHYYRGNTVYYMENHAHHASCGHRLSGGIYIHID